MSIDALEYMPRDGRLGSAEMEGLSNGSGVTPDGVRAGDPATLHALVDRRGPAVIAFCTQVCGPGNAATAAAEAFARFRAAVRDAPDLHTIDPETLLRGATRHAAASMARVPAGPPPSGRLRSRGTQTCEHVPIMLAARANGALGAPDLERLSRHLDRCERCNAMAEIFHRAELAYQDPAIDTLGTDTSSVLLAALRAVPADRLGVAPAPIGAEHALEPQDGAFGHLPDLEDEVPVEVAAEPEVEPVAEPPADVVAEPDADGAVELEVEHVDEPAEELDAQALAAEPLPDQAPPLHAVADLDEHDPDFGETVEWDTVPSVAQAAADTPAVAPVVLEGGTKRRAGGPMHTLLIALPVVLVAAAIVAALAIAGVFGGNDGTPPQATRHAPTGIQAPVTTPLPVKVPTALPAKTSQTGAAAGAQGASTAAPSATGTGTTGTGTGAATGTGTGTGAATGTGTGAATGTGTGAATGTGTGTGAATGTGAGTGTGTADGAATGNGGTGAGAATSGTATTAAR